MPRNKRNELILAPVRANAGIAAAYRQRLDAIVQQMNDDVTSRVFKVYRAYYPEIALDEESSSEVLTEAETRRVRAIAEGNDDLLRGPQATVLSLERKGLVRLYYDTGVSADRWELTPAGEEIARKLMTPATRLKRVIDNLRRKWLTRIEETAPKLATYFAQSVAQRSKKQLEKTLSDGGFTVRLRMTPNMRTVYDATVTENVGLIRSIPQQYLNDVEGIVMRSVTRGRDLALVTREVQKRYGLTRKRAALIALDQNNKATSAIVHVRQLDLGIKEGVWRHSHAGKEPRPTHVAMDGKKYPLAEGLYDSDERVRRKVFPGELIRCRCFWQPVVAGFSY